MDGWKGTAFGRIRRILTALAVGYVILLLIRQGMFLYCGVEDMPSPFWDWNGYQAKRAACSAQMVKDFAAQDTRGKIVTLILLVLATIAIWVVAIWLLWRRGKSLYHLGKSFRDWWKR